MDVDLAVLADAANVSQEGKLNILGIFDTIWGRDFPLRHGTMVFVVRVEAQFAEQGEHHLELRLMDADGSQVFRAEGPLHVLGGKPGRPVKPHIILGLSGVVFAAAGDYSFEVLIDGQHKKSVPLYVVKAPESQRPTAGPLYA
ncbi:MAG: hypothetical protein HY702_00405 [Gemmatimonadetes bacterium]|nr:hypothetical protein [Gemmatimonadota bacterium]